MTKPRTVPRELSSVAIEELCTGRGFFRGGDVFASDEEAAKAWQDPATQAKCIAYYHDRRAHRCCRPWAWWQFSSPEPRDRSLPEPEQLRRMGLLSAADMATLAGTSDDDVHADFRRPLTWWWFEAPEPRDFNVPEGVQLERMGELSETETKLLEVVRRDARPYGHLLPFILPSSEWAEALGQKRRGCGDDEGDAGG